MVETEFLADRRISLFILFCYYLFGTLKTRRRHEQQEESDVKDTGDCGTCMCLYFTHTVLNTTILTYVSGRGECICVESIGTSSMSRRKGDGCTKLETTEGEGVDLLTELWWDDHRLTTR